MFLILKPIVRVSVLMLTFSLSSCGDSSVDINFNLSYSTAVQARLATGTHTARVFYEYTGLVDANGVASVNVQPRAASPRKIAGTSGQPDVNNWVTAAAAGYDLSTGYVQALSVPLNKVGTVIGIEILELINSQWYVVAYGCFFLGSQTAELNRADLEGGSRTINIELGRTCGHCRTPEAIPGGGPTTTCSS